MHTHILVGLLASGIALGMPTDGETLQTIGLDQSIEVLLDGNSEETQKWVDLWTESEHERQREEMVQQLEARWKRTDNVEKNRIGKLLKDRVSKVMSFIKNSKTAAFTLKTAAYFRENSRIFNFVSDLFNKEAKTPEEASPLTDAACPLHKDWDSDAVPAGFRPYVGDASIFHCGFAGIIEEGDGGEDGLMNECFYNHDNQLLTASMKYGGCRGSPNEWAAGNGKIETGKHYLFDTGGICEFNPEGGSLFDLFAVRDRCAVGLDALEASYCMAQATGTTEDLPSWHLKAVRLARVLPSKYLKEAQCELPDRK